MSVVNVYRVIPSPHGASQSCYCYIMTDDQVIDAVDLQPITLAEEVEFQEVEGDLPVSEHNGEYYSYPLAGQLLVCPSLNCLAIKLSNEQIIDLKGDQLEVSDYHLLKLPYKFSGEMIKHQVNGYNEMFQHIYRSYLYFMRRTYAVYPVKEDTANEMVFSEGEYHKTHDYSEFKKIPEADIIKQYLDPIIQPYAGSNRNDNRLVSVITKQGKMLVYASWDARKQVITGDLLK